MAKNKITSFFIPNIVYVLILGFILRILLSFFGTLSLDQGTFVSWSLSLAKEGFKNFYNGWSDYLPGYLYVLWLLGKINLMGAIPQTLLYKIPAILSDILTGYLIYKILKDRNGEKWGLIGTVIYIFNPAILWNSALWGQVDSLTALLSVFSIFQFPFSIFLSATSLAVGTLIKPQAAFIFPIILFLFIKQKRKFTDLLFYCLTGLTVFTLGFVPFWNHGNLFSFILERLGVSANQYPYISVNAFNFWGLMGMWKPDNLYFQFGGYAFVLFALVFLFFKLWKRKNAEYYFLSFVFASSFIFFTRMHERHLLPVFAPLAIAAVENPIFLIPYIGLSFTYIANLYYSYVWISSDFKQVFSDFLVKFIEVVNVSFVIFIFFSLVKNIRLEWKNVLLLIHRSISSENNTIAKYQFPQINLSPKKAKYILVIILTFAFITRIYNLGSPKDEYFDEVYHAFTAKVMTHADANKAWEWWNTPPEGFAYEWTHPPLAKLGMIVGMKIFGENSFGWRIPGAILGLGSVLMVYLLAKIIFEDEMASLLSAGVFSLDGLTLVMSRIGMNDSYLLFFSLLSIHFFIRKKDFWAAGAFGLALSSKWSAIWAIPILGVIWLQRTFKGLPFKVLIKPILWFLVLPFSIYLLTYLPMFLTGHDLVTWWGMQEQMWWYHTGLKATHSYGSPWWSWPMLIRSIYLYTSDEIGGTVARIYAFGNPFIFWFGFASVILSLVYAYVEKNRKLGLIVFSYFIFFAPWAASPRIMFLYHYLPSIPFLAIATGYILRRNPKFITPVFVISTLAFLYFYPHWAGLRVPIWLDSSYYWIASWR